MEFHFYEPSPLHQAVALWSAAGLTWLLLFSLWWWIRSKSQGQWSGIKVLAIWIGATLASIPVFVLLSSVFANIGRPPGMHDTFIETTWWTKALVFSVPAVGVILGFLQRLRRA